MSYLIKTVTYTTIEDDFEKGQTGTQFYECTFDLNLENDTLKGVLEDMAGFLDVPLEDAEPNEAYPGRVEFCRQEDEAGNKSSPQQIALWKVRKFKLFDAFYSVEPWKVDSLPIETLQEALK